MGSLIAAPAADAGPTATVDGVIGVRDDHGATSMTRMIR